MAETVIITVPPAKTFWLEGWIRMMGGPVGCAYKDTGMMAISSAQITQRGAAAREAAKLRAQRGRKHLGSLFILSNLHN